MPFMGLKEEQRAQLEMEIVPNEIRLKLTRMIRDWCSCSEGPIQLVKTARYVNIANHVMNRQVHPLEPDDWGEEYPHAAYALIETERELIMRRPSTVELVEILGDYLQSGMLEVGAVNDLLSEGNCGFLFRRREVDSDRFSISIRILSVKDIPQVDFSQEHPNIRVLVNRMDRSLEEADYPAVVHTCASIFETLAKDVVKNPKVQDKTLASFFGSYRKESKLPGQLLDFIEQIYRARNTEPLAGHGSLAPPKLTEREAVALAEMTKAIVRTERKLAASADQT